MKTPKLDIRKFRLPSELKGQSNGKIDPALLRKIRPTGTLYHRAAEDWHAMREAAWNDGILLSLSQGYRTYDQQVALFKARYTTEVLKGRPTKRWQGKVWYQKPNTAQAATPGFSNHGWGCAVDLAIDADGDEAFEWPVRSIDQKALRWLLTNAARFNFGWELQSEPWHVIWLGGEKDV